MYTTMPRHVSASVHIKDFFFNESNIVHNELYYWWHLEKKIDSENIYLSFSGFLNNSIVNLFAFLNHDINHVNRGD